MIMTIALGAKYYTPEITQMTLRWNMQLKFRWNMPLKIHHDF